MHDRKTGAVIVEFVLVAPLLVLLLMYTIEFANILHIRQVIFNHVLQENKIFSQQQQELKTKQKLLRKLSNLNINTKNINVNILSDSAKCINNVMSIDFELIIPFRDLVITGDPLGLFQKNFLKIKTTVAKVC